MSCMWPWAPGPSQEEIDPTIIEKFQRHQKFDICCDRLLIVDKKSKISDGLK